MYPCLPSDGSIKQDGGTATHNIYNFVNVYSLVSYQSFASFCKMTKDELAQLMQELTDRPIQTKFENRRKK